MKKFFLFAMLSIVSALGMNAQTWTGNDVAVGDFYLYNIGAGKWLSSGNSWGTQASLVEAGGFCSTLEISNGQYAIKNTETRTNQKAAGPGYLGTNGFMDGENAAYFTFAEVTGRQDGVKAYYIQDGTNNLTYSGSGTVVNFGTETGDNAQWVLVTKADRLAAMANASETNPVDATFLLKNAEFGRYKLPAYDAAWTFTFPGGTNKNNAGDNTNFCVESYHVNFDFCQTVSDAPNGYYAVRGQAFYRQDGSNNTDLPYFYVGSAKVNFPVKSGSEGSMSDASNSFKAGSYQTAFSDKYTYTGGGLKVGTHLDNNTALWCIWDNIQIQYYGPIDLSAYATELANAVSAAQAYQSQLPEAVYAPIADAITANNKTYTTEDGYVAAINAINDAVSTNATAEIIAAFSRYNSVKAAAKAIAANMSTTTADNAVNAATTNAAIDDAVATLRATFLTVLPNVNIPAAGYIDVTAVMVDNAGVHTNTDYWTAEGTPNTSYSWAVCNYGECEFYQQNFKFYQTLALTPGTWEFGVTGFHRAGNHNTHFYAGVDKILIPGVESSVVNSMAAAKTYFDGGNGKVALKFLIESASDVEIGIDNQDTETDKWTIFRDFTLKYYGAPDYSVYVERWNTAKAAADEAKTNYPNVTGEELTALNTAYANAPVSGDKKAQYIEKCEALESATVAFNAAGPKYNAYVAEKDKAAALGVNVSSYTAATNATDADTKTKALKVAEYDYVNTNYQYGVELGTWTSEGPTGVMTGQHWDNTATSEYLEQSGEAWGQNSWSLKYSQNVTLPAGSYIFKVAGRHSNSNNVQLGLEVTLNGNSLGSVNDFPAGDVGRGIDTTGATNYDDEGTYANSNNGRGWEWRYVKFTLNAQSTVNIAVNASATAAYQWVGFCNATIQTNNEANVTMMAYYVAKNDATTALANENVTGSERTNLQSAVNANPGTTKTEIENATQNLIDKTAAFREAEPAYNAYAAVKALCPATALTYATTAKKNAVTTITNSNPTSAQNATDKTTALTTALRAYYESHALAEGATGVIVNKTNSITNPAAENGINGWTTTVGTRNDQPWTDASNNSTHSYFDANGKPLNATMEQTINLSAGKYLLTAKGRASAPVTLTLEAGGQSVEMSHVGASGNVFNNGWGDSSIEFTTDGGEVTIKVTATSQDGWFSVSDFRLIQLQSNAQAGDVDGNGTRNIDDVEMLVNYLVGKNPVGVANPDTDGDKKVSLKDVTKLVNLIK